jgi:hypothetical protein
MAAWVAWKRPERRRWIAVGETNFSRKLKEKLEKTIEEMALSLVKGGAMTHDAYLHEVGIAEGLQIAIEYCNEMDREYE